MLSYVRLIKMDYYCMCKVSNFTKVSKWQLIDAHFKQCVCFGFKLSYAIHSKSAIYPNSKLLNHLL